MCAYALKFVHFYPCALIPFLVYFFFILCPLGETTASYSCIQINPVSEWSPFVSA